MATLVIIPCGQAKIWDKQPEVGAVQAQYAYTGAPSSDKNMRNTLLTVGNPSAHYDSLTLTS